MEDFYHFERPLKEFAIKFLNAGVRGFIPLHSKYYDKGPAHLETNRNRLVCFADPVVTGMWEIPRVGNEDKESLFYSRKELRSMRKKIKSDVVPEVTFADPMVNAMRFIPLLQDEEIQEHFYSHNDLYNFLFENKMMIESSLKEEYQEENNKTNTKHQGDFDGHKINNITAFKDTPSLSKPIDKVINLQNPPTSIKCTMNHTKCLRVKA